MNENNKKNKLSFNKVFGDIREKITKITYYKIKENPAIKQAEIMICLLYTSDAADEVARV